MRMQIMRKHTAISIVGIRYVIDHLCTPLLQVSQLQPCLEKFSIVVKKLSAEAISFHYRISYLPERIVIAKESVKIGIWLPWMFNVAPV